MSHVTEQSVRFQTAAASINHTLSLHDALPICRPTSSRASGPTTRRSPSTSFSPATWKRRCAWRSEEHTSELQSRLHLVCRLLLEKQNNPYVSRPLWPLLSFFRLPPVLL